MHIRSHLDPVTFVIFAHIDASRYDPEFVDLARKTEPKRGSDVTPLMDMLKEKERGTFSHERYHYWQGLRLPFLHMHAFRMLREVFLATKKLATVTPDWVGWPSFVGDATAMMRLEHESWVGSDDEGNLTWGAATHPGSQYRLKLTCLEMLECAASIYDFQSSCESYKDMSDIQKFRRWRKRNPAYLNLFDFLAGHLGSDEVVLRLVIPLINACFHTSYPERAFVEMIARLWRPVRYGDSDMHVILAEPEPKPWSDIMKVFLKDCSFDLPMGELPKELLPIETRFYHIDAAAVLGLTAAGEMQHPFLGPLATEWMERAKDDPELENYLDAPWYVLSESAHKFALEAQPPMRIVRIFDPEGQDRVFTIGEGAVGAAFVGDKFKDAAFDASAFRAVAIDMMAVYGAFRRATGVNYSDGTRTCYHDDCPHYAANFCNAYPLIPLDYADCGFPGRLQEWIEGNLKGAAHV